MLELARGKAFEDLGWFDKAMAAYDAAGEARVRAAPFDLGRFGKSVDTLIAVFDGKALARAYPGASDDTAPVFVLGMPRSGTTLCEHILGSHPDIACPGELQFWMARGPTLARSGPNSLEGTWFDALVFLLLLLDGIGRTAPRPGPPSIPRSGLAPKNRCPTKLFLRPADTRAMWIAVLPFIHYPYHLRDPNTSVGLKMNILNEIGQSHALCIFSLSLCLSSGPARLFPSSRRISPNTILSCDTLHVSKHHVIFAFPRRLFSGFQ